MRSCYICMKALRKTLKIWKRSKFWSLQETGDSYKKGIYSDNRGQSSWNNAKGSSEAGQGEKTFISVFE